MTPPRQNAPPTQNPFGSAMAPAFVSFFVFVADGFWPGTHQFLVCVYIFLGKNVFFLIDFVSPVV